MGKYMRKAKLTGEIALMEVSHPSSLGVRTRAKTLALQRLHKNPASLTPAASPTPIPDASSYLQLRNRRLEKPLATAASRPKDAPKSKSPHTTVATCSANSGHVGSASTANSYSKRGEREVEEVTLEASPESEGVEASFGENVLEFEARDRNVRETTPCSLIRDSEVTVTPGSTTRTRTTSNRRTQSTTRRDIPTSEEMEVFFAGAEQQQQRMFTEKYNFDPAKDCPLPGRYEWVRLDN